MPVSKLTPGGRADKHSPNLAMPCSISLNELDLWQSFSLPLTGNLRLYSKGTYDQQFWVNVF